MKEAEAELKEAGLSDADLQSFKDEVDPKVDKSQFGTSDTGPLINI